MIQEKKIPICPNCQSSNFKETWVKKSDETKTKLITFEEHSKEKIKSPPQVYIIMSGTYDSIFYPTYIQYVLTCADCGYTVISMITSDSKNKK
jgi:predicted nucleic-acid-binding Zn-ribbon protein